MTLTPAQRWRWLFAVISCSSCQAHHHTRLTRRFLATIHSRRFSTIPTSTASRSPISPPLPPPSLQSAPRPTRLSIPSPTTFSPTSRPSNPPPHPITGAWFYHSLEDKLRDAESDAQKGDRTAATSAFLTIIDELLAQSPEPSIHQLQQVKRAYIRTFDPSTLPMPLMHRIIVQSGRLQPLLFELTRLKLPLGRSLIKTLLQTTARLRSVDETIATLRFIRDYCVSRLELTAADYNDFLRVFAGCGDVQGSMFVFDEMQRLQMKVGMSTWEQLLYACGRGEMVSMAMSLLEHVKESGVARSNGQDYLLPATLFEHLISGLVSSSTTASFRRLPCLPLRPRLHAPTLQSTRSALSAAYCRHLLYFDHCLLET